MDDRPGWCCHAFDDHQSGLFQLVRDIDQRRFARTQARSLRLSYLARCQPSPPRRFLTALTVLSSRESINIIPMQSIFPVLAKLRLDNPAWSKPSRKRDARHWLLRAPWPASVWLFLPQRSRGGIQSFLCRWCLGQLVQNGDWHHHRPSYSAGAMPIDTFALLAEIMSTWNRPDAMDFAGIMVDHIVPPYRALMEKLWQGTKCTESGSWTKLNIAGCSQNGRSHRLAFRPPGNISVESYHIHLIYCSQRE